MGTIGGLSEPILRALHEVLGLPRGGATPALCGAVAELSRRFTHDRPIRPDAYLEDPVLRAGYLAYFFPVNLAKVQMLLSELPSVPDADRGERPGRVLDVGCGPGTAALAVLDWLHQRDPFRFHALHVVAVDHSRAALRECKRLWTAYQRPAGPSGPCLVAHHCDVARAPDLRELAPRDGDRYDLIILANTLNELFRDARDPVLRRTTLVRRLLDWLDNSGSLIILEPALRSVTRELHEVRDNLLADRLCTVYSPCLRDRPCPALAKSDDWCHEERPWTAPSLVVAVDRQVGFIKDALKFSYVILRKDGRTIVPRAPGLFRVVSELRKMKGEKRAWLCNELGRPEVGRLDREYTAANAAFDQWHRGAIVRVEELTGRGRNIGPGHVERITRDTSVTLVRPVLPD